MKKYLRIMRLDHWIKQLFILPGVLVAFGLTKTDLCSTLIIKFVLGFLATCLIASANYVINEWLDAEFDKFHPTKKHRAVVEESCKKGVVYTLYACLTVAGLALAALINAPFFIVECWLWVMGVLYNVKPIRTKDIAYLDVLSESVNNMIRFLLGWFLIDAAHYPPVSIVFGYWMAGAFLMATKRFSEFRMIGDKDLAAQYRKSFRHYTEQSLLISAFFYALIANFFIGIFLVKYRVELLIVIPFLMGLFCYYFKISFEQDSVAQRPEKLIHNKGLMIYVVCLSLLFAAMIFVRIPWLAQLTGVELVPIQ